MAEQLIYQRLHQCNNALPKNRDDLEIKNVKGKGKGIFTTKPIKKGSLITLYPVHIIIKYNNNKDDEYAVADKLYDEDEYNNIDKLKHCIDYFLKVTDEFFIMGDPQHIINEDLIGHLCNDKGYHPKKCYRANLNNSCIHNLGIYSLRDIKAGEELCVAYGKEYWYNNKNGDSHHEKILRSLKNCV